MLWVRRRARRQRTKSVQFLMIILLIYYLGMTAITIYGTSDQLLIVISNAIFFSPSDAPDDYMWIGKFSILFLSFLYWRKVFADLMTINKLAQRAPYTTI